MKKIHLLFIILVVFINPLMSCSKEAKKATEPSQPIIPAGQKATDSAPADNVALKISEEICARVLSCKNGTDINLEECRQVTNKSLKEIIDSNKIVITYGELETCLNTIKTGNCEEILNSKAPPKGCEKLK